MEDTVTPIILAKSFCNNPFFIRMVRIWSPIVSIWAGMPLGRGVSANMTNCTRSTQPCPCGYYNHPEKECVCGPGIVKKYLTKISGPLLDRIDLHVEVTPVSYDELSTQEYSGETSQVIRARVSRARLIQEERFTYVPGIFCNAQMPSRMVRELCQLDSASTNLLKTAMNKLQLSARAYDRILKVARTCADLAQNEEIKMEYLAEAIQYRSLDREGWAG